MPSNDTWKVMIARTLLAFTSPTAEWLGNTVCTSAHSPDASSWTENSAGLPSKLHLVGGCSSFAKCPAEKALVFARAERDVSAYHRQQTDRACKNVVSIHIVVMVVDHVCLQRLWASIVIEGLLHHMRLSQTELISIGDGHRFAGRGMPA